jgi:hypothetical protein
MGQQRWVAYRPVVITKQLVCGDPRRHSALVANSEISLPGLQVEQQVCADDLKGDFWMDLSPEGQARHQPAVRKGVGRGQTQNPLLFRFYANRRHSRGKAIEAVP